MKARVLFWSLPDRPTSDWWGLSGSTLCLIHCLAGPIVFGAAVAGGWHLPWLDWLFALIAAWAVSQTVRSTQLPLVRHLLIGGLALFTLGLLADVFSHASLDANLGVRHLLATDWFHLPGALLLLIGHALNLRAVLRCRTGACAHPHHAGA